MLTVVSSGDIEVRCSFARAVSQSAIEVPVPTRTQRNRRTLSRSLHPCCARHAPCSRHTHTHTSNPLRGQSASTVLPAIPSVPTAPNDPVPTAPSVAPMDQCPPSGCLHRCEQRTWLLLRLRHVPLPARHTNCLSLKGYQTWIVQRSSLQPRHLHRFQAHLHAFTTTRTQTHHPKSTRDTDRGGGGRQQGSCKCVRPRGNRGHGGGAPCGDQLERGDCPSLFQTMLHFCILFAKAQLHMKDG